MKSYSGIPESHLKSVSGLFRVPENPDYSVPESGTTVSVLVSVSAPLLSEADSDDSADPVSVSVGV